MPDSSEQTLARAVDAFQRQIAKHLEMCIEVGLLKPETTVQEAIIVLKKSHPFLDT